jgi:hypothetical protein
MIAGVTVNPYQSRDRNFDELAAAAAAKAAAAAAAAAAATGAGLGGTSGSVTTEVIPPPLYVPSSFYDLENMFPVIPTSSSSSSSSNITVNVEAGTLVMQDELVSLINDAVIAANKNGYIQLPNGAIVG